MSMAGFLYKTRRITRTVARIPRRPTIPFMIRFNMNYRFTEFVTPFGKTRRWPERGCRIRHANLAMSMFSPEFSTIR